MNEQATSMLFVLGDAAPVVAPSAWIAPGAVAVGAVRVGPESSVWYGCVVRADDERVDIGRQSNVQDGALMHADPGFPVCVHDRVTVGHGAVIHGAVVEDDCIVGMRAVLLNGVRVGRGSIVAAGAVLREGTTVPPGSLVAGVPAVVRREVTAEERTLIADSATEYVAGAARHRDHARRSGAGA